MRPLLVSLLAVVLMCAAPMPARAQTIHPVDVDGKTINLVVPKGYCKLDESDPGQAELIDAYNPDSEPGPPVILLFMDCDLLNNPDPAPFMTDRGAEDIGIYVYFPAWTELLEENNATRAGYITAMQKFFGEYAGEWFGDDLKARFATQNDPMTSAMLVYSANIGKVGPSAIFEFLRIEAFHSGEKSLFGGAIGETMVHHRSIHVLLLRRMRNIDDIKPMMSEIANLMSAFLGANPDSDD